jgi:glycosyltransferase involved in cell wall biosynthesis
MCKPILRKPRFLFVGGFSVSRDGTEGGQSFACRSLIASPLSDRIDWILVDSTQRSEPPPGLHIRAWDALRRLSKCLWTIVRGDIDGVLVFTSLEPLSLLEKGLVCIFGHWRDKHVIVSYRSFPRIPAKFGALFNWYAKRVCDSCNTVICQSTIVAQEVVRLFGADQRRIEIVHNWIDISRYSLHGGAHHSNGNCAEARIIFVGWLHSVKGLEYLIRAARLLADDGLSFRLTICGNGGLLDELKTLAGELRVDHMVHFEGWVPNERVCELMNQSDIFVLPSLSEGMPNSLLQAMACELPVVATNVSSIPALICDGENGFLAPPKDPEGLYRGLKQLILNPAQARAMGQRNRHRVLEHHDISKLWPRVARILNVNGEVAASS